MRKWWRLVTSFGLGSWLAACGGSTNHNDNGSPRANGVSGTSMTTAGAAGAGGAGGSSAGASGTSEAGQASCNSLPCAPLPCELNSDRQPVNPQLRVTTPSGECCAVCEIEPSCNNVSCLYQDDGGQQKLPPNIECPAGYDVGITPGACCFGCVRNALPFQQPSCGTACPEEADCRNGYTRKFLSGSCCPVCVPDPAHCNTDADCVVATRDGNCCGDCPWAISVRMAKADACWREAGETKSPNTSCKPLDECSLIECAPCSGIESRAATCVRHRCELRPD